MLSNIQLTPKDRDVETAHKGTAGEKTTTENMRPTWATLQESVSKQQQEFPTKTQKNKTKISEIIKMKREKNPR